MAALFLIFLLLATVCAVVGDDGASLPHLQLRGIPDSGPGNASDASPLGLMGIMSMNGCRNFAGLLAAAPNASEAFEQCIVAGGLTVFCPEDPTMAAFEPKFNNLSTDDQLAVLLFHGVAARYGQEHFATFQLMVVRSLAYDTATNKISLFLTVWTSSPPPSSVSGGVARVTKAISSGDSPLAVYVVDAVLLPSHLRQIQDGGYLWWLHCTIRVWQGILLAVAGMVSAVVGILLAEYHFSRRQNAAMH